MLAANEVASSLANPLPTIADSGMQPGRNILHELAGSERIAGLAKASAGVFVWKQWAIDVMAPVDEASMPGEFSRSWAYELAETARVWMPEQGLNLNRGCSARASVPRPNQHNLIRRAVRLDPQDFV
jgi:hypothetical protein